MGGGIIPKLPLQVRYPKFIVGIYVSFICAPSNKELPPIATCALAQSKNDLAYVLDVGGLFCLVCALPLSHLLAIHRHLYYGMVVGERLPILHGFVFKLALYVLRQRAQPSPQCTHDLVMLRFALRLRLFDDLISLEHFITSEFNNGLTLRLASRLHLVLEVRALWIVLGYVLQPPTIRACDLVVQRLVCEDVGTSNLTRRIHPILVELDFTRLCVRRFYETILVVHSFLCFNFHHRPSSIGIQVHSFFFVKSSIATHLRSLFACSPMGIHVRPCWSRGFST